MKKGLVVQRNRRNVIIMAADGSFHKMRMKGSYEVGEEVEIKDKPLSFLESIHSLINFRRVSAVAIIFFLIFVPAMMMNQPQEAYAYVNLDINPSIELAVNENLKVTDLTPINQEAQQVKKQLEDWKGQSVEMVTLMIINQTQTLGYLSPTQDIFIGVSYLEDIKHKNQDISNMIQSYINDQNDDEITVNTFEVPEEIHQRAQEEQVSMNYLYAQEVAKEEQKEKPNTVESENQQAESSESSDSNEPTQKEQANQSENDDNNENDDHDGRDNGKSQKEKIHQKLIEKFIDDKDFLPPGLKKKMEDKSFDKAKEEIDKKSSSNAKEEINKKSSNKAKEERNDSKDRKNKWSKNRSKEEKKSKEADQNDQEQKKKFLPPGLKKNDKKVPTRHKEKHPEFDKKDKIKD
ncbi:Anti-sigma factor N-terminus [Salinibacillus kushneri]|uniref:Anti-sigma factor N-terminus n=1 Tax=Salinibacillus kushneri TaxID=237682 RepID=A0A1I0AQY9_9BACI|nr:anti-sigma factor domain-containing protein [Salinibacillus kushneri]SES96353.1 Anti-sigma factor N-terminus [Salinibacillus kushneri]